MTLPPVSEELPGAATPVSSLSIILPCRDEEESVVSCIDAVREALSGYPGWYEIVVVDNGSTDRSYMRALAAGARVVSEPLPGYGNACRAGLEAAAGDIAILADADGTYDFSVIPTFMEMMDGGAQLVLGSRLKGNMEKGAMPWLHRLGTPVLTSLINRLFRTSVSDVNCGIRAVDLDIYHSLELTASGMEFASEMVVNAAIKGLTVAETPVDYNLRKAGVPKLRTWHDGWRHLRLALRSWAEHGRGDRRGSKLMPIGPRPAFEPDEPRGGDSSADRFRI